MSKHTPWTDEQAEEAALEWCREHQYSAKDRGDAFKDALKWAAAQIEKCPSQYAAREGSRIWGLDQNKYDDTMEAKLVGVREVEK